MATNPIFVSPSEDKPASAALAAQVANDNEVSETISSYDTQWRRYASALPTDAVAIIEPDPLGNRSGGRAREGLWHLRFRVRARPFVDPLTGWTGGCDPLTHLDLSFRSREAAEDYCRRYGIPYECLGTTRKAEPRLQETLRFSQDGVPTCCMPAGPHPVCCGEPSSGHPLEAGGSRPQDRCIS
ncbi:NADH dehydrogenase ubiquinone Fe-S protein 4 [Sphingomonas beigongshangi]|uniref:NADH dehydrogenase ubiquinone Fe-S protein 4 n=1 Tax=Sphingomonas beigongshangi TaxID=2782540 RepID=UPI001AEEA573|nr:NADH dehydrogenase ubiquinone Fe-S protein 4 [Sphingomonas beigongshangi]